MEDPKEAGSDKAKGFKNQGKDAEETRLHRRADRIELRKKEREQQAMKRRNVTQGLVAAVSVPRV